MRLFIIKRFRKPLAALTLLSGLMLLCPVEIAKAFSVSPIVVEMESVGRNSRASIRVTNPGKKTLPVEITVREFELDKNGKRRNIKGGDELLIFPPQTFIRPGATQNFRIQWVGEPLIKKSRHFMASVTQLPVKMKNKKSSVQILMSFGVMLNIAPPRGNSSLSLVKSNIIKDKKGVRRPAITVKNKSNVHALLREADITVSGGSWSKTLRSGDIRIRVGVGLVQSGKSRRFVLPIKVPAGVTRLAVSMDHHPKRR